MKKINIPILAFLLLLGISFSCFAKLKVLIVVEEDFYFWYTGQIEAFKSYVEERDNKKCDIIPWPVHMGTNVGLCDELFHRLQTEYANARNAGDALEGAVLIGNVPVPMYNSGTMPLDQVYMDILDVSGQPYSSSPYYNASLSTDYYSYPYGSSTPGDQHYEIWVSRINAAFLNGLRRGMLIYDAHTIYLSYLSRMFSRMDEPANVPSRGFAMGGPQNRASLHSVLGQSMISLNLPWLAEYSERHNSSFNWMSQLLAGPRGCINYGGFNGSLFPTNERNRRYCRYTQLPVVYPDGSPTAVIDSAIPDPNDSLGWEWAGLYNHSCPIHTNFFSEETNYNIFLNGQFGFGMFGPFWGSNYLRNGGYLNNGYYFYKDEDTIPNPYGNGLGWKNKGDEWRWPVTISGDYQIYLYYEAPQFPATNPNNSDSVNLSLHHVSLNGGLPSTIFARYDCHINQQTHINHLATPDTNWEQIFGTITLNAGDMAIVSLQINDEGTIHVGDRIVDAVRFIGPDDHVVQATMSPTITGVDNDPSGIFSAEGFHSNDDVFRGFEDIGSEPGGGGISKTLFFLTNCCEINNFLTQPTPLNKNIGNLYALGDNGLICMGASTSDYTNHLKDSYITNIQAGNDFGQAYLAYSNTYFFTNPSIQFGDHNSAYNLLGAGTLRAQPYIQYGSITISNRVINSGCTQTESNPILIRNVTVNGNGSWDLTSYHNSWSPFGTHAEIIVRPETVFSPTGTNEVHLKALNQ
jgi:hypothetical protein